MQADPRRILVVEDEALIRNLLVTSLEQAGFAVHAVEDGRSALDALERFRAELVVLDLMMPRMHGYEVIQHLRASPRTSRLPILVMSGKPYPGDQRKAMELGGSAFLAKPFVPSALVDLVRRTLDATRIRFWGVRGSIATPGPETIRYGGNTPCVTIEHGRDLLILDAGTGLRKLGLSLQAEAAGAPLDLLMLITHTHWDHIQGFPFFVPAFIPGNRLHIMGPPSMEKPLAKVLRGQMDPEYFPVALGELAADVRVDEVREPVFDIGAFRVESHYVNHPGVTMAYRIHIGGHVITYATDTEPYRTLLDNERSAMHEELAYAENCDRQLVEFARGSDVYIADSQYSPDDYRIKRGWGHTCYEDAVSLALAAEVGQLVLFSHDPMHDDDAIDRKLMRSRELVRDAGSSIEVVAAIEGETIELTARAEARAPALLSALRT
ncbi:MAG: response regulator [Deltaproteobacteria bacterium]|nr:response regulator [Deltaproteobacteria bacterium]